jgi:hypothetical protein
MSTPNPSAHDNQTDWQLLTEFLVPNLQQMQVEVVDHVADILRQFSLDPGQLDQILVTISQSLDTLEDSFTPLRLRISVSDAVLAETWPETYAQDGLEPDHGSLAAGGGLGFFLVKRFVGQLQEQDPKRYRLVEVLLYRE